MSLLSSFPGIEVVGSDYEVTITTPTVIVHAYEKRDIWCKPLHWIIVVSPRGALHSITYTRPDADSAREFAAAQALSF